MSLVTTASRSSSPSARHNAATRAVFPDPTGPPMPMRRARRPRANGVCGSTPASGCVCRTSSNPGVCDAGPGVCGAGPGVCGAEPGVCGAEPGVCGAEPGVCGVGPGVCGAGPGVCGAEPAGADPAACGRVACECCSGCKETHLPGGVQLGADVEQRGAL